MTRQDGTTDLQEFRVVDSAGQQIYPERVVLVATFEAAKTFWIGGPLGCSLQQLRQHGNGQCHWEDLDDVQIFECPPTPRTDIR